MPRWAEIRPGWILAFLILIGWLVGIIGDGLVICPPSLASSSCDTATVYLAQNNALVMYLHTYWQLFSSIFVTDSILDAVFNAIAVLILDRIIESSFNKSRYFMIFFLTAIFGNILTLLQGPHYASAGASGGIFGLFAATFSYTWSTERRIDNAILGFFVALFVGSSFILPDINWVAHLGGVIGGFVSGPLLYFALKDKVKRYESVSKSTAWMNIATLVFVFGLTSLSIVQFLLFIS